MTSAHSDQVDGLRDTTHWRHVNGLLSHDTAGSNASCVLTSAAIHDGADQYCKWIAAGQQMDDLKGVLDDADSLDLFSGVATVVLHGADEALDDGTEGLSEAFGLVAASSVG